VFHRLGWPSPWSISTGITPGYLVSSGHTPSPSHFEATSSIASATMNRQDWLAMTTGVPSRRQLVAGAVAFAGCAAGPIRVWAADEDGISHTAESIHQERVFQASRKRVYEALTEAIRFDRIVQSSEAVKSGMALGKRPTEISRQVGGAFTLFGGHIIGRHVELVPSQRIVQAWRVVDWNPGIYSIVKFELAEQG
jgi:Activator of Hsp90 ATPase homolog 1-like protein